MAYDPSNLIPPPMPSEEQIERAAVVVAKLSEIEALAGQIVTFTREGLDCGGVWPRDTYDLGLAEVHIMRIPEYHEDVVDEERCYCRPPEALSVFWCGRRSSAATWTSS